MNSFYILYPDYSNICAVTILLASGISYSVGERIFPELVVGYVMFSFEGVCIYPYLMFVHIHHVLRMHASP